MVTTDDLARFLNPPPEDNNSFNPPNTPAPNGIGLPFAQIPYNIAASNPVKRKLIHWLIPDMGVVKMYVNPESLTINNNKLIQKERVKGGYNLQYWGEDLTTIRLSGTTGTAGIEGINMLYEIYRSEQYTFDPIGLSVAAKNSESGLAGNIIQKGISGIGGGAAVSSILSGFFNPSGYTGLAPRNIPSLANNAFTIEMYYDGWVYRGYFNSMTITESASDMFFRYDIGFTATQRRGYRTNFFPWHKSPINGGGDTSNDTDPYSGQGIPYTFTDFK